MNKNFLQFVVSGCLMLWLSIASAAAPRFDNWGSWDKTAAVDEPIVLSAADSTTDEKKDETKQETSDKTKKTKADKPAEKKTTASNDKKPKASKKKASKVVAAPVKKPDTNTTSLGPPTKRRHIATKDDEDRRTPTPEPKIVVKHNAKPKAKDEEDLSWWERWKRKRKGIPLKPVFVPSTRVFTVRMQDSQWKVAATRLECSLTQVVPRLGKVMFEQKVGSKLQFKMVLDRRYEQIHQAKFEVIPPIWGHQQHRHALALPANVVKSTLTVPRDGAMHLINQLLEGMDPRLTYRAGADDKSDAVEVTLSAVTFTKQLPHFQQCIDNLLPFQFDEVKESIVYFNFDSAKLTAKAKKALTKVAEYVRLDKAVKRIVIAGYTDNKGFRRYNYRLATRRSKAVESFFLSHGVNKSRLTLSAKAYGEKKPAASNRSAKGRAQNRRVHVTLYK